MRQYCFRHTATEIIITRLSVGKRGFFGGIFCVYLTAFSIFALFALLALYILTRVDAFARFTTEIIQNEPVLALLVAVFLLALEDAQAFDASLPISTLYVFARVDTVARLAAVHVQLAPEVATGGAVLLGTLENYDKKNTKVYIIVELS